MRWETEDGFGTAADSQRQLSIEERIAELEKEKEETRRFVKSILDQLEKMTNTFAAAVENLNSRINDVQDANIAPMLESSAVIVQLTRIADYLDGGDGGVLLGVTAGLGRIADALEQDRESAIVQDYRNLRKAAVSMSAATQRCLNGVNESGNPLWLWQELEEAYREMMDELYPDGATVIFATEHTT